MPSKMLLILNPVAGKMRAQAYDIPALFPAHEVTLYYTEGGISTEEYVSSNAAAYDLLVCAGGDGTLNHVIGGLMRAEKRPPLGYIPCGTTNDFAASLGLPKSIPLAAAVVSGGQPEAIDIGSLDERYFCYSASFGAFTESSYSAPQGNKNKLGRMAYFFEAMREFPHIHPCHMTVETDNGRFEGDYVFGAVSNSTTLGGMLHLSPDDVIYNDGLFEVMLISMPRSILDYQQILSSLMRQQYNSEYITFFRTKHAVFSGDRAYPWSLDGEYESGSNTVEIKVHPGAVRLIL